MIIVRGTWDQKGERSSSRCWLGRLSNKNKELGEDKLLGMKESKSEDEISTNCFRLQDKFLQAFVGFYLMAMAMIYRRKALWERRNRRCTTATRSQSKPMHKPIQIV
jgi:hypothetical protein